MTMRLDIVTNDAGELVRREHARDLGAGVVVAVYRLAKLAQMHDLTNQAFMRQLEQTHQIIGEYCLRSGSNVNVLFAHKAIFVAGQLLKGSRGTYDAAAELGDLLERLGGSELFIQRDVTREELLAFAEQISVCHRTGGKLQSSTPKIRLRPVSESARLRGIDLEDLSPEQRIVRAYASAVVIMRRFFEDLQASKYILPRRIKRIAQSLVDLSDASTAAFLGVTEVRNANYDEAGRAANTAILAVAIARELTQDRAVLSQIAMAAMMHDVARPRAMALAAAGGPALPGMQGPTTLSEDQEDRLASGAAAVLTALGRVNEPSITRTVLAFEALWLRRQTWLGPVYWGARPPTLHSSIIAVARRYNDLLTPEPGLAPPTPDYAVAVLASELTDAQDRSVLRMLVSALGLLPLGTMVQLSTGEVAEVTRGARALGDRPAVRIVADANSAPYPQPIEVDLARDPRAVMRVLSVDGWRKGLSQKPNAGESGYDPDAAPSGASKSTRSDPSSLSSGPVSDKISIRTMGSSPSAVAAAMGRMISASQPPIAHARPVALRESQFPEPTARGNLASTPLPHVLVYMLDHALTGTVVFEGEANGDTLYFVNGVPVKARLSQPIALLGQVLVEAGALDADAVDKAVDAAQRSGTLLGEFLLARGLITQEMLAWALEAQLLEKVASLANLQPGIEYVYYRDADLLAGWGKETAVSHPLNAILGSVRNWTDRARVRATLNRIAKHPLVLHEDSDISALALTPEEQLVIDVIRERQPPLRQLFAENAADEETVSSLVYTLAVARQFAFKGLDKGPMAVRGLPGRTASNPPGAGARTSGSIPAAPPAPTVTGSFLPAANPAEPSAARAKVSSAPPNMRRSGERSTSSIPSGPGTYSSSRPPGGARNRPVVRKVAGTMLGVAPPPSTDVRSPITVPPPPLAPPGGAPPSSADEEADEELDDARTIALIPPSTRLPATRPLDLGSDMAEPEAALEAMEAFRLAEAALTRNDVPTAERFARKAVDGDPSNADYQALFTWIHARDATPNDMEQAIATLTTILRDDPGNDRALSYRGKLLVRTGKLREALGDLTEALRSNPENAEAAAELDAVKQRLG